MGYLAMTGDPDSAGIRELETNLQSLGASERAWQSLQDTLTTLSLATIALSYLAVAVVISINYRVPRYDLMAGPSAFGAGAILILFWQGSYRAKSWALILFMLAAAALVNHTSNLAQPQMLYAFICLVTGILLGPRAATGVAMVGTVAIVTLVNSHAQVEAIPWNLVFLWLTASVMWAAMGNIVNAIRRSEGSEARAWHYARQANTRRGELARAKKTLSDLYDLLQRTNHELAVAREEAEEARQIKAQFAANISHELRTPLNLILGFSEMMYRSPEVYGNVRWTPALSADIYEVYQASRHLSGMIDDILDLSRIESHRLPLRLEPTDIAELIREAAATAGGLLRGKGVTMNLEMIPELPDLVVDRMRIRQVLLNLLNNAIRFTDRGEITVAAEARDGEVVVSVADTGVGIAPEEMETIFEEFGQAKSDITGGRGGAGLGLAICRQFIHLHGGRIEAESVVGEGSTFRFYLPLPQSGRARARLSYYSPEGWSPPVPENPLGKTVIVLGTDTVSTATLARNIQGYRAVLLDGCGGLAERVDADHPAGVVLVRDPLLPAPFSPEDVLQATGRPDLPVVTCEVPTGQMEVAVCRELGLAAYLEKPIQREQLVSAITQTGINPRRFLVVDDNPGFVTLVSRILEAEFEGAEVNGAYSGEEARAILAGEELDLVLMDLIMPEINGLELIESMREDERLARVPVIVTTGSSYAEEVAQRYPGKITILRGGSCSEKHLGCYISALLDAVPPDYSLPVPVAEQPAAVAGRRAS